MHALPLATKKSTASKLQTASTSHSRQGGGADVGINVRPLLFAKRYFYHFYPVPKWQALCGLRVIGRRQGIDVLDDQIEGDQGADSAQQRPEKLP